MWNIRFLVLTMLMTLKKTRKAGYTAYWPTEGLENGPFLGRKASKNVHFWIFLDKGPRWEDRATRRALEKVYFKKSYRMTKTTLKLPYLPSYPYTTPERVEKSIIFFTLLSFFHITSSLSKIPILGEVPDERTPPWSNNTAIYLMTSDVTLQWPHNVTSVM